jgi:hypothetical protein
MVVSFITALAPYAGGTEGARQILGSKQWAAVVAPIAAETNRKVTPLTRALTVNERLFPQKAAEPGQPAPPSWQKGSVSAMALRGSSNKPLLYAGVYLPAHSGAYFHGSMGHANPIYSKVVKRAATTNELGRTPILFVGGHAAIVDPNEEPRPVW